MSKYSQQVLVKALLKLISIHLTNDFDVVRWVAIVKIFDEDLCPDAQEFVLNNIYIPKGTEHLCPISKMAEVRDALEIRTTF